MTIRQRKMEEGWRVVEVSGRLDATLTPELDTFLQQLIDEGHASLIVDLSAVDYINSGGLRSLVSAWRKTHAEGGELYLAGLSDRVLGIFEMVGFERIFQIHPDVTAALDAGRAAS